MLNSFCTTVQYQFSGSGTVVDDWFDDEVSIDYNPAAKEYTVTSDAYDLTFTEAHIVDEEEYSRSYRKPEVGYSDLFSIGAPRTDFYPSPTEFARFAVLQTDPLGRGRFITNCVTGVTTEPEDTLGLGTLTYSQLGSDFENFSATATDGEMRSYFGYDTTYDVAVDADTGDIEFSISLRGSLSGTERFFGTFNGSTTVDDEQKRFSGVLTDGEGNEIGSFGGWFFGPAGEEVGISWTLDGKLPNGDDLYVRAAVLGSNP
tara:strand:+ start:288372 stop:289148 length:777 start_codon:yes stop_codon:yes gene_type:complete